MSVTPIQLDATGDVDVSVPLSTLAVDLIEPDVDDELVQRGGDSSLLDAIESAIADDCYDDAHCLDEADAVSGAVAVALRQLQLHAQTLSEDDALCDAAERPSGDDGGGDVTLTGNRGSALAGACGSSAAEWRPPDAILSEKALKVALQSIVGHADLPAVPRPQEPVLHPSLPMQAKVAAMQRFIAAFEYNYTGVTYVTLRKDRGMLSIMTSAKEIVYKALPIQCIEAVFLGVYLTRDVKELERFPVSFKSVVNGHVYRHIILALRHKTKWGALGLSRKSTLMGKDLVFDTFADLVLNYQTAYKECWHTLKKVYVGLPFTFDAFSQAQIKWRVAKVRVDVHPWPTIAAVLNKFAKQAPHLADVYKQTGSLASAGNSFRLSHRTVVDTSDLQLHASAAGAMIPASPGLALPTPPSSDVIVTPTRPATSAAAPLYLPIPDGSLLYATPTPSSSQASPRRLLPRSASTPRRRPPSTPASPAPPPPMASIAATVAASGSPRTATSRTPAATVASSPRYADHAV